MAWRCILLRHEAITKIGRENAGLCRIDLDLFDLERIELEGFTERPAERTLMKWAALRGRIQPPIASGTRSEVLPAQRVIRLAAPGFGNRYERSLIAVRPYAKRN